VGILAECRGQANILEYKNFFDEPAHYYLVTEEISGGELFERICAKETCALSLVVWERVGVCEEG